MNTTRYVAVQYSPAACLPLAIKHPDGPKLAITELGQHSSEQHAIAHAMPLLGATGNIGSLLQKHNGPCWVIYNSTELTSLLTELDLTE